MKPLKSCPACILGTFLVGIAVQPAFADAKPNPYQAIIERNPFALKPPPKPLEVTPPQAVVSIGKVILTGITSLGPAPKALLEITEQEPGKTATTRRPILQQGERDGAVEVLSIDVEKSLVKIRNAGNETNISFEVPKIAASAAAPAGTVAPAGFPPPPATASTPTVISPANAAANNLDRGSGVTIVGGGTTGSAAGSVASYGGNSGVNPAATPGVSLAGYTPPAVGLNGGLGTVPSRPLRTDTMTTPSDSPDPAKQYLNWHLQHEIHTSLGRPFPPPPPLPDVPLE